MDDLLVAVLVPDVRRIFHDVVSDGDQHVRPVDSAVHIVMAVDARREQAVFRGVAQDPFPICVCTAWMPVFSMNAAASFVIRFLVAPEERMMRGRRAWLIRSAAFSTATGSGTGLRIAPFRWMGASVALAATSSGSSMWTAPGRSAWASLNVADDGGNAARINDLDGAFRDRPHNAHHVDELKTRLPVLPERLLTRDGNDRRADELGVGDSRNEVRGAGTEGGEADAGPSGQPAVRGGHEGRRLLMARHDEFNRRRAKGLEEIERLFPRQAEDILDALFFELPYEQVRCLHKSPVDMPRIYPD